MENRKCVLLTIVIAVAVLLSSCGPAATPAQVVTVKETVVVRETRAPVKETVVVKETQAPVKETVVVKETQVVVVTPTPEPTQPVSTEPVRGGVFKAAIGALPPTLDSATTTAVATSLMTLHVMETLVAYGEDYSVVPMLAESWDTSADGTEYTFHLRKGVKFHNGKEMTSDDVMASIERYLEVSARKSQFDLLTSYEAPDAYTVVMHLEKASAAFLGVLALPLSELAVFPAEIIKGKAAGEVGPQELIGTGPYKLAEYVPDRMTRLVRNEDYSPLTGERDGLGGAKIAYFDEIQLVYVPEAGARVAGLEVGDYDWIESPPETEIDRINADPALALQIIKPAWGGYILFNHAEEFSGDVKFRQAILAVLDMEAVLMAAANGRPDMFDLNESIWPKQTAWYFDDPISKALYDQKNVDKAMQLLQEAGYDGEQIVIVTNRDYGAMYKMMLSLADQLQRKLGMNVKVEIYDWPGNSAKWGEEEGWHISATLNVTLELVNPNAASGFWGCAGTGTVRCFYCNPEMDKAFATLDEAPTFEQRKEALKEVQRIFYEDLPNIKVGQIYRANASSASIKGYSGWYKDRFFGVWRQAGQ